MIVSGAGTKGRLEACQIWANTIVGVAVQKGGDPTLRGCTIRDHRRAAWSLRGGAGLFVCADSAGKATTTGCVFARNAGGDVVRAALAPDAPPGMAALRGKTQAPRPALHPHALTYAQAGNDADDRYCSVCEVSLTDRSGAFRCDFCDYDACIACFEKEVVARG